MKNTSPIASASGCAALAIFLAGCNPPIMVDRSASNQKLTAPAVQTTMSQPPIRIG